MRDPGYNPSELLICTASRLVPDSTIAFIGTGIPMLAASLAQKSHAPNLVTIFEFGGTGAIMDELPSSVGGRKSFHKAVAASSICDVIEAAQRGFIVYGFLGGAQIDPCGNLNSTVIGDFYKPKARLPGSGGGNDVGSHCWRTIAVMRHDTRRFVEKVDFITTPGYLSGPGAREAAGLPEGTGPYRVVTPLALMGYHPDSRRMMLLGTQPGITVDQVVENTGFELLLSDAIEELEPPTKDELRILRDEVDREGLYI